MPRQTVDFGDIWPIRPQELRKIEQTHEVKLTKRSAIRPLLATGL